MEINKSNTKVIDYGQSVVNKNGEVKHYPRRQKIVIKERVKKTITEEMLNNIKTDLENEIPKKEIFAKYNVSRFMVKQNFPDYFSEYLPKKRPD